MIIFQKKNQKKAQQINEEVSFNYNRADTVQNDEIRVIEKPECRKEEETDSFENYAILVIEQPEYKPEEENIDTDKSNEFMAIEQPEYEYEPEEEYTSASQRINSETEDIVNLRLFKYNEKRRGMLHFDNKVLNAIYGLNPETIKAIKSNSILYALASDESEIKTMYGKSTLDSKGRIEKINKLEETFSERDLENISLCFHKNSYQAASFLRWMLSENSPERNSCLVEEAKEPFREIRHKHKRSIFEKLFGRR